MCLVMYSCDVGGVAGVLYFLLVVLVGPWSVLLMYSCAWPSVQSLYSWVIMAGSLECCGGSSVLRLVAWWVSVQSVLPCSLEIPPSALGVVEEV